jgi:hypothetical protein
MKKEKKLFLDKITIESFINSMGRDEQKQNKVTPPEDLGVTFIKIFC